MIGSTGSTAEFDPVEPKSDRLLKAKAQSTRGRDMAIPDYQTVMLPLLKLLADGKEYRMQELAPAICEQFDLSESEQKELTPSGKQTVIRNRLGWARTYMKKAGLIEHPKRGVFRITARGRQLLSENPDCINVQHLEKFPEFIEFRNTRRDKPVVPEQDTKTPEEALDAAYEQLRASLEAEILAAVTSGTPEFFERLVVDVLVHMGYGGNRKDAGQAVGKSGDGGIDGIIKEDKLGLDTIFVQAKKWDKPVPRPEIQKFAGALQGVRARKGVFITTSSFSDGAVEYAHNIENKIVLIDGKMLAGLMIDHNVGVSDVAAYEVKRLDSDYFEDD
jgi:restriction system protein